MKYSRCPVKRTPAADPPNSGAASPAFTNTGKNGTTSAMVTRGAGSNTTAQGNTTGSARQGDKSAISGTSKTAPSPEAKNHRGAGLNTTACSNTIVSPKSAKVDFPPNPPKETSWPTAAQAKRPHPPPPRVTTAAKADSPYPPTLQTMPQTRPSPTNVTTTHPPYPQRKTTMASGSTAEMK